MQKKIIASLVALTVLSSGCANTRLSPQIDKDVDASTKQASAKVKQLEQTTQKKSVVEHQQGMWLAGKPIALEKTRQLPAQLLQQITMNREVNSLNDVAERITVNTGIPVFITPEAANPMAMTGGAPGMPAAGGMPGVPGMAPPLPSPIGGMPGTPGMSGLPGQFGMFQPYSISYKGPVSGLLDLVAAKYGVSWEFREGRIVFFLTDTKTFTINAIPGTSKLQATVSSTTSGGSGSSGSGISTSSTSTSNGQSTSVDSDLSVWQGIEDSIKSMLSTRGKVIVSPATGTVTVTDTPNILSRVESYVDDENAKLSKQVMINVKVLSVNLSDKDQYGINWNVVFNQLSKNFGWTYSNAFPVDSGASSLALKVLNTATATNLTQLAGSQAIINAFSTQGKVSLVTSASVTTLNNQPVPVQVGRDTSYIQSVSTTATTNAGTTATITPGIVSSGFSMNLLPHMLDNNKLLLQYAIDISTLLDLKSVTSGGQTIQTPDMDKRNFLQRVALKSGETLILSGFEQSSNNMTRQGVGSPQNSALGGGINANTGRDVIVIMITPVTAEGAL